MLSIKPAHAKQRTLMAAMYRVGVLSLALNLLFAADSKAQTVASTTAPITTTASTSHPEKDSADSAAPPASLKKFYESSQQIASALEANLPLPIAALLDKNAKVVSAQHNLQLAINQAKQKRISPYDWSVGTQLQKKVVDRQSHFREWAINVEHPYRLPSKTQIDEELATLFEKEGRLMLSSARHDSALSLVQDYLNFLLAQDMLRLRANMLNEAKINRQWLAQCVATKKICKMQEEEVDAEWREQQHQYREAQAQAQDALSTLQTNYPVQWNEESHLPIPSVVEHSAISPKALQDDLYKQNENLALFQIQQAKARLLLKRAQAEKTADPNMGFFMSSAFNGKERVKGISFSMPLPGETQTLKIEQAVLELTKIEQEAQDQQRQIQSQIQRNIRQYDMILQDYLDLASLNQTWQVRDKDITQRYAKKRVERAEFYDHVKKMTEVQSIYLKTQYQLHVAQLTLYIDAHALWRHP